jgi:hypothetical protein
MDDPSAFPLLHRVAHDLFSSECDFDCCFSFAYGFFIGRFSFSGSEILLKKKINKY